MEIQERGEDHCGWTISCPIFSVSKIVRARTNRPSAAPRFREQECTLEDPMEERNGAVEESIVLWRKCVNALGQNIKDLRVDDSRTGPLSAQVALNATRNSRLGGPLRSRGRFARRYSCETNRGSPRGRVRPQRSATQRNVTSTDRILLSGSRWRTSSSRRRLQLMQLGRLMQLGVMQLEVMQLGRLNRPRLPHKTRPRCSTPQRLRWPRCCPTTPPLTRACSTRLR